MKTTSKYVVKEGSNCKLTVTKDLNHVRMSFRVVSVRIISTQLGLSSVDKSIERKNKEHLTSILRGLERHLQFN